MASGSDLKKRITTVKNTQQITRAMKMVSAAKLRRAQDAITNNRPYAKRVGVLIRQLSTKSDLLDTSPLLRQEARSSSNTESVNVSSGKKATLILVTSDRGLCGGFNSSIIKAGEKWIKENKDSYESIKLGFLGKKGHEVFKFRSPERIIHFEEFQAKVTYSQARKLADWAIDQYLSQDTDEVYFVYNEFKNAISQEVVVEGFLPVLQSSVMGEASIDAGDADGTEEIELSVIKPSPEAVLKVLLGKHFGIQVYRIMLESQASEHGARMAAMDNATRNAGDVIQKLQLQYNKQRQAGITTELLEITAGTEAQKN